METTVVLVDDGTSKLPENIRHHILSFLEHEEAVKTSVLSKAWLSTWRTRPDLQFIRKRVVKRSPDDTTIQATLEKKGNDFVNSINTTLTRYHENKYGIETLKIYLPMIASVTPDHVNTWFQIAVENGVKILSIGLNNFIVLPETVFRAKSLVKLWLGKFQLNSQVIQIIRCHGLRKLSLIQVNIDEVMLQRIISSCPSIEYLKILLSVGFANIKVTNLQKLKQFKIQFREKRSGFVELEGPSLEEFCYWNCINTDEDETQFFPCSLQMYACKNLKRLRLREIAITEGFFSGIAENFPLLEELTVQYCDHLQNIKISSQSIKRIYLDTNWELKEACIDVPSIVRFKYSGDSIPLFSFTAPSGPCIFEIDLQCQDWDILEISWFSELKELLTKLNKSEISLDIQFPATLDGFTEDEMRNNAIFPVPQVQKLSIGFSDRDYLDAAYLALDSIFWTCRPKTIVQSWHYDKVLNNNDLVKVLFEMLMLRRNQQQTKFWQQELKAVKLEMFKEGQRVRFPELLLDLETFLKSMKTEGSSSCTPLVFDLEWETAKQATRKHETT
ncbi:hypothetical protein ACH5RR_032861 [Cinchona calisaya]|uniref:F-box domain-containing protein n=1 Tax=Cinchona calisaya TaxID=153742 RepID=A0ABD2YJA6_9GENT